MGGDGCYGARFAGVVLPGETASYRSDAVTPAVTNAAFRRLPIRFGVAVSSMRECCRIV